MRIICVFVVFLTSFCFDLSWAQWTANYCSQSLCSGLPHIACGNDGNPGSECRTDSHLLDLTPYRTLIVDRHNRYRNEVAGGKLPRFSPALRMATMRADDELEYIASLNVLRCIFEHDDCRNTDRFKNSGQNLAYRWDPPGQVPTPRQAILWALDYWFSEYADSDQNQVDRYYSGRGTEHFLLMVAERNTAMGCACLQQSDDGGITTFVACNYATTNILDRPIYRRGKTASQCRKGTNPSFPNLCNAGEQYNLNDQRW